MGLLQEKPQPEAAQVDSRLETASGYVPGRLVPEILLSKPPRTHGVLMFGRTMEALSPFWCSRVLHWKHAEAV